MIPHKTWRKKVNAVALEFGPALLATEQKKGYIFGKIT
jgi:hypothetical protein